MKTISEQSYQDLKAYGHGVPRYESSGETLHLGTGKTYTFVGTKTKDPIQAKCTQTHPCHVKTYQS